MLERVGVVYRLGALNLPTFGKYAWVGGEG